MIRDIRDPKELGEKILRIREADTGIVGISDNWEALCSLAVPAYVGSTLGEETAATYLHELQCREAEGDRYAISTLAAMREGKKAPIDPYGD